MHKLTKNTSRIIKHLEIYENYLQILVCCRIVVVDAQTFLIPHFSYDGQAPDAHFWSGKGQRPGPEGEQSVSSRVNCHSNFLKKIY